MGDYFFLKKPLPKSISIGLKIFSVSIMEEEKKHPSPLPNRSMSSDMLKVFKIIETLLKTNSLLTEKLTASYSSGDSLITAVVIGKKNSFVT